MKYATVALALAGTAAAAPAASCPALPSSFEITNFKFGGQTGPVILEGYNFDVKGNIGPSTTSCGTASGGRSNKCPIAFRDIEQANCTNPDFTFSFLGSDTTGFTFAVNYTLPHCGTLTGCRFFPASDIHCVPEPGRPSVRWEDLTAPTNFTLEVSQNNKCIFG